MEFLNNFLWGSASASYQIEGGVKEGGRGVSIWDTFSHTSGKIKNGDTGDIAADSFHRWREDVQLVKDMGLAAYRFSIAWPRIDSNGDGCWNPEGFAYYDGIVDALLEAGIQPWVTLYHWDLPQALQDKGGWLSLETVRAYAAYAARLAEHFKGRVTRWFTFNEPQCFIGMGYGSGEHAPGLQLPDGQLEICWKNFRLAHEMAYDALHRSAPGNLAGLASTGTVYYPVSQSPEDIDAARRLTFALPQGPGTFSHTLALEWGVRLLYERYGLPLYISENGLSCRDWVSLDGQIHDPQRIDFLTRYLQALDRGIKAGADVRGYFHWSLTDNFEWAEGYSQRFGLAYVDYTTGKRILKDSGAWYAAVVQHNGL